MYICCSTFTHTTWNKSGDWEWCLTLYSTWVNKCHLSWFITLVHWRFLVGWCLFVWIKWKLIAWKNSWEQDSPINTKTQTTPLGATSHEKVNEQQQHALSFFYIYFLTSEEVLWILIRSRRTPNTDVSVDKQHPWFLASILWKKVLLIHGCLQYMSDTFLKSPWKCGM